MPFFQSLSNYFGGGPNNASSSRRAAVNSTFDAFRIPSSSSRYGDGPSLGAGLNDSMNGSDAGSPGPSRRGSTAYTYPPHDTYRPSSNLHPPLSHTFHRLRKALAETFPELLETLNGPVNGDLLAAFERELGCQLPGSVRESFFIADGQDLESGCNGLFYGLYLLPLEDVIKEWTFWRQAEHDPDLGQNPALLATMASVPPQWVKSLYACRGWLPLISDRSGNYVGVDLDPGQGGSWGQVIVFGRDFDRKCILWRGDGEGGWGKWLAGFVEELESGEGWEADRSSSSDEEEELGYNSYSGAAQAGESGKGMRLAGEYRGWNVMEAWWDRSVRNWEQIGLGLDVDEIERGLEEARRLSGWDQTVNDEESRSAAGRSKGKAAEVEIPVFSSPQIPPAPSTPTPGDDDELLPPASPEHPINPRNRGKAAVRIITPINSTFTHPLQRPPPIDKDLGTGLLSPPHPHRRRPPAPAPVSLDLPTRADVQAMSAIAQAEASGLRGGWVMNIDTGSRAPQRSSIDAEMVDIDLEGGRGEKFGVSRYSDEMMIRQREKEKANLSQHEAQRSPQLISTRTPSPLSRDASIDLITTSSQGGSDTGRSSATPRNAVHTPNQLASAFENTLSLQRPPPIAKHSYNKPRSRALTPDDEMDSAVIRPGADGTPLRSQRESSVISTGSQDGLLDTRSIPSRSSSPPDLRDMTKARHIREESADSGTSPTTIKGRRSTDSQESTEADSKARLTRPVGMKGIHSKISSLNGLDDSLEEVSLTDVREGQVVG